MIEALAAIHLQTAATRVSSMHTGVYLCSLDVPRFSGRRRRCKLSFNDLELLLVFLQLLGLGSNLRNDDKHILRNISEQLNRNVLRMTTYLPVKMPTHFVASELIYEKLGLTT
jgi:hypothetical protein